MLKFLKSKTVWASIFGAAAWVLQQPEITGAVIIQAGSVILGAIGVKDAISKMRLR